MASSLRRAGLREKLCWLVRRRELFRVGGSSMEPTLRSGDEVLIAPHRRVKCGVIVVARHPFKTDVSLIKRVTAIDPDGRATLEGDNPSASTDSRTLGTIGPELFFGPVTSRL